jgi:uncharacterized protein YybS (DUF2232 family)
LTGPENRVRDGVILCGVFTVLIASLFTPFSILTIWFLPLPFLLFTAKHSLPSAVPPAVVICVLTLILLHPLWIFGILFAAVTGMVMGALYRSSTSTGTDVVLAGLVVGIAVLLSGLVVAESGFQVLQGFERLWQEQWDLAVEWIRASVPNVSVPALPPLAAVLPLFLSALTVPSVLLSAWAGRRLLVRFGFPEKGLPPFYQWRFPRSFLYFYLLAGVAYFLFGEENGVPHSIFAGLFMILDILFMVQGLAFIAFLLHRRGRSRGWLWLAGFALFIPPAALLILVLGILDVGTRWRERMDQKR